MKTVTTKKIKPTKEQMEKKSSTSKRELQQIVDMINKKHGDGAITLGVPDNEAYKVEFIPTGSLTLDIALGGGIPRGRYTQIAGQLSSTKTTQCAHIVANAQKMGLVCAWFDVEGTSDEDYFRQLGIDYDSLLYSRPDGSEEAFDVCLELQKSGVVDLAVIDSIAALSPNKEQNKESLEDNLQMGITQKLLGEFFRKYQANNNRLNREGKFGFTLICINQIREKPTVYGNPEYTPGGNAKDFAQSVDIRLRRGDWIAEGKGESKEIVGQVVKFRIEKNKVYRRGQTGEYDFYLTDENNAGVKELYVDRNKEIILLALELNIIEKKGAWMMYGDLKFQGLKPLIDELRTNDELFEEIREQVIDLAIIKKK